MSPLRCRLTLRLIFGRPQWQNGMMPRIIDYLDKVRPVRSYNQADLALLQRVYDEACAALQLAPGDERRETIAGLIFHLADEIAQAGANKDAVGNAHGVVALFRNATQNRAE